MEPGSPRSVSERMEYSSPSHRQHRSIEHLELSPVGTKRSSPASSELIEYTSLSENLSESVILEYELVIQQLQHRILEENSKNIEYSLVTDSTIQKLKEALA